MREDRSSSAVQDYGSVSTEKSLLREGAGGLLRLADLAREPGSEPVAEEAHELAERIAEGRFYVACVGQFKRGKSTLLNALAGHAVAPTGFVPVTAVPTVIRFGDELRARTHARQLPARYCHARVEGICEAGSNRHPKGNR